MNSDAAGASAGGVTRRTLGSVVGRLKPWTITVALVAAAVVLVPAASATIHYGGSVTLTAVDGSTFPAPTEINVRVGPAFGTDLDVHASGSSGEISLSYVQGADGIADWPNGASSVYLNLDESCVPQEADSDEPYLTIVQPNGLPYDVCWAQTWSPYSGLEGSQTMGPLGAGSLGFLFVDSATGADGATPVVFDHWDVTGAAPMGLVLAGQTTPGVAGYCTSGDRGYFAGRGPAFQSYVNPSTGVGMDVNFKAVYMPADPDTSAPEITFLSDFDCADFVQDATQSTTGLAAVYRFLCDDPGDNEGFVGPTGVASCTGKVNGTVVQNGDPIDTSKPGDYTLTVTAVDNAGNTRTKSATYHVLSNDNTPPTTTISLTPSLPSGNNGWYRGAVTVAVSASDNSSGVADTRCALDPATPSSFDDLASGCAYTGTGANVSSDGQHMVYGGSEDNNGNKETPVNASFKIDGTAPTVTCPAPAPTFALGSTGNQLTASVSDTASQPVHTSVSAAAPATGVGLKIVNVTGEDNAGNQTSKSCSYLVAYGNGSGFLSPPKKSIWKRGQTVPIKLMLTNAQGIHISDSDAAGLAKNCNVTVAATGPQTIPAPGCMKYDATQHQFVYNWNLPKTGATGTSNLTATINYPGGGQTTFGPLPISIT